MGATGSKLDKAILDLQDDERYYGLENFGNTCYANSVIQTLYFCRPFRERVLEYGRQHPCTSVAKETLLDCLADLFLEVSTQKKKSGLVSPRRLISRIKADNPLFSGYMHQDAHEFLIYLLNNVSETLAAQQASLEPLKTSKPMNGFAASFAELTIPMPTKPVAIQALATDAKYGLGDDLLDQKAPVVRTWVQELFEGKLVNQTRCLCCESVSSREEAMFDLSLEIEPNSSVTSCLRNFSSIEMLEGEDKFSCDTCNSLQEAQKSMRIQDLPEVLCLHLKRFKYLEQLGRMTKLSHRVVFPFELKVINTTSDCADADTPFDLFGVVVHMGAQPHHGHYVALVKSNGQWICCDDDQVVAVTDSQVQSTFGQPHDARMGGSNGIGVDHSYILMYQKRPPTPTPEPVAVAQTPSA